MSHLTQDDELPSAELAPRRLLEGAAVDPARRLLDSARLDRAPDDARARIASALGSVLEPPAATSAARGETKSRIGSGAVGGMLGAGLVGVLALSLGLRAAPEERSNAATTRPMASVPAPPPTDLGARSPEPTSPVELAAPTTTTTTTTEPTPPRRVQKVPDTPRAERSDSGLLAEVRALESVSAALAAGATDRATRELAAYRRRFARGELAIEAEVLDVQLAIARGERETANARAERLLARPGAEHYRARVRSLLAGSNDEAAHMRARR
ncbi:MAG TPA: hypothetical protein VMG12_32665 [Polyangiaceae bacterium]|nr:hypothetical protein [Polyangiaceae bacterium]